MTEKINTHYSYETDATYEQEAPVVQDELRESLLEAPEGLGSFVRVPEGTIAVDAASDTLTPENLATLSAEAKETAQLWRSGGHIPVFGRSKVARASSFARMMRGVSRTDRETGRPLDMTLLYNQNLIGDESEAVPPSGVLVHEKLTPQQIAALRAELPEGVPLLDSKTNELLDDVGAERRAESRRWEYIWRNLGRFVLGGDEGFRKTESRSKRRQNYTSGADTFADYDWISQEDFADMDDRFRRVEEEFTAEQENRQEADYEEAWGFHQADQEKFAESEEVRRHRERVEKAEGLLNEAAATYGADRWQDLDIRDQERIRKRVLRDVHPDREGGDKALFQEVEFMTKDIRKEALPQHDTQPASSSAHATTPEAETSVDSHFEPAEETEPVRSEAREPLQLEAAKDGMTLNEDSEEEDPEAHLKDENNDANGTSSK